jgi:hypothetical protein
LLEFVENRVFAAARPEGLEGGLGQAVTLRRAIQAALPFVAKSFPDQPLIEARLRRTLGMSFRYLSDWRTAAEQYEAARALYGTYRVHFDEDGAAVAADALCDGLFPLVTNDERLSLKEALAKYKYQPFEASDGAGALPGR